MAERGVDVDHATSNDLCKNPVWTCNMLWFWQCFREDLGKNRISPKASVNVAAASNCHITQSRGRPVRLGASGSSAALLGDDGC